MISDPTERGIGGSQKFAKISDSCSGCERCLEKDKSQENKCQENKSQENKPPKNNKMEEEGEEDYNKPQILSTKKEEEKPEEEPLPESVFGSQIILGSKSYKTKKQFPKIMPSSCKSTTTIDYVWRNDSKALKSQKNNNKRPTSVRRSIRIQKHNESKGIRSDANNKT